MRLTVNVLQISKLERLIESNELLKQTLKPDAYGGWHIEANERHLAEQ